MTAWSPNEWQTFWAAVNALAAVGAAIGAWLAVRIALRTFYAGRLPTLTLSRAHGKTQVTNHGPGHARNVVLVGHVGDTDRGPLVLATALMPGEHVNLGEDPGEAVSYNIGFGNALFCEDLDGHWYWVRAVAGHSLQREDNVAFRHALTRIPRQRVPVAVIKALDAESAFDWLERESAKLDQGTHRAPWWKFWRRRSGHENEPEASD
jgi:hypothetical protein